MSLRLPVPHKSGRQVAPDNQRERQREGSGSRAGESALPRPTARSRPGSPRIVSLRLGRPGGRPARSWGVHLAELPAGTARPRVQKGDSENWGGGGGCREGDRQAPHATPGPPGLLADTDVEDALRDASRQAGAAGTSFLERPERFPGSREDIEKCGRRGLSNRNHASRPRPTTMTEERRKYCLCSVISSPRGLSEADKAQRPSRK